MSTAQATRNALLDAALSLIAERTDATVPLAEIAERAGVSRQAVYNHFPRREELLLALLEHVEEQVEAAAEVEAALAASSGVEALRAWVGMQARRNPRLWPIARAVEAVQRVESAGDKGRKRQLLQRQRLCRSIAARLAREGLLRRGLGPATAADLICVLTSLRTWDELVNQRGWTAERYQEHVVGVLLEGMTGSAPSAPRSKVERSPTGGRAPTRPDLDVTPRGQRSSRRRQKARALRK